MFKYLITTQDRAKLASRLAHGLSRPSGLPETQSDITEYQFNWLAKSDDLNLACAVIDVEDTVFVHQYIRDSINSGNGISSYFNAFYLTVEEASEKKQVIVNSHDNEGGLIVNIPILSILPNDWQNVTEEYLQQDGWFTQV